MINVFVEGIPGSGKTTLLKELQKRLPDYSFYYEGDISPVELAWCSYMTEEQYQKALIDWPKFVPEIKKVTHKEEEHYIVAYTRIHTEQFEFYQYMEAMELYGGRRAIDEFQQIVNRRFEKFHGNGNVFECSFFQNIIEELMLFGEHDESKIIDFYRKLLKNFMEEFLVLRLVSPDIETSILQIKKERVNEQGEELWYHAMMEYLINSPYGKLHKYKDFSDMLNHFNRRLAIEKKIEEQLLHNRYIDITSKEYDIEEIIEFMEGRDHGK